MKISARNVFKGKVASLVEGQVYTEVVLELPGGDKIASTITKTSAEKLGLAVGKDAYAIVKASNVLMGVD